MRRTLFRSLLRSRKNHVTCYSFGFLLCQHPCAPRGPRSPTSTCTMPLVPITSPPVHATPGVATEHTSTTPKSFEEIPPTLVLQMDDVFARLQPVLPALVVSDTSKYACARGRLWLTEKCLAFLPESESHLKCGFQVDYPSIALHAIARSVPEGLRSQSALEACLYCQLDDHPERDEEDDEEGDVHELWFAVRDAEARAYDADKRLTQWTACTSRCRTARHCTHR